MVRPIAMLVCLLASGALHAAQIKEAPKILAPGETRLHHRVDDVSFTPSDGKLSRLSDYSGKAIVLAFTSSTCPVALRYRPRLTELTERFKGKVEFLIINSKADSNTAITAALAPSSTTEVFLLDAARTVLYRGAIDDQYGLGYQLEAPRETYLVDAIESLLASRPVGTPATIAPGCEIECKTPVRSTASPTPITFHSRISRIIQYNCQECHRPGEPAPFNLLTYDDAKSHAKTIKRVVERKIMPPWFAESGHWANDRRLSDADRNDLLAWIAGGSPEGDPSHAPLDRRWETGWRIGKPDAVFEVPRSIKVAAQGAMPYQEVVVATGLAEDKWVKAVEVRSTQPQVTHHILVFEEYPSDHPRDPKARPNHLEGLTGYFAGMVPGQGHLFFPENTAKFLPKAAGLRFQIHYTPNGTACEDKPKIGVLYADAPPKHEILTRSVATTKFLIPANESNYAVTATKTFTEPTRIFSFNPHSHVRGKAFKYELVMPDGARTTLLDLPHYDFNWQIEYRLKEPLDVPIRSKLVVTAWYDNSKDNPANPDPNKDVGWGEQTWDEMMNGYYTRHSLARTRVGSTQVAATASPPVAVEGADSETGVLKTPDGKPLKRITQPGDLIFASSGNSRGSEGVANAIDNNKTTKYLNWDSGRDGNQIGTFSPSGFAVQPAAGPTVVTGMGIQSANDASDRDPDVVVLEGSNDANLTSYESGTWTPITTISNVAAGFTARFQSQEFFFSNSIPYRNYRWRVEATRIIPNECCMQVAEVWLTTAAPPNQAASPAGAPKGRGKVYDTNADGSKQIAEALDLARKSDKNVLLQFGGDWCIPCLKLHRLFETNTTIHETLRADYVVVHVECNERNDHLVTTYRARELGMPFLIILDSGSNHLTTKNTQDFEDSGQHRPEQVLAFLKEWTPAAMRAKPITQWVREFIEKPASADATIEFDHIRRKATEAVPCLIDVIKMRPAGINSESRWAARMRACDALASIAPKTAVPLLAEQFISDRGLRDHLRVILSKIGPDAKEAIPTLINAFRSSELDLQFRAAWVLAHVDPQNSELVPTMITWLQSSNVLARRAAPMVLAELGLRAKSSLPALVQASSDADETVRQKVTNAIARIDVQQ